MSDQFFLPAEVDKLIKICKKKHGTLVLATGVFDLLHQEHKNFLIKARQAGDCLLVGVETDLRVKQLKGKGRPVDDQETRINNLTNLNLVDAVFLLPEKFATKKEHLNLIKLIKPNILAVSAHSPNLAQKAMVMQEVGGVVKVVCSHNPAVSTSILLNNKQLGGQT